LGVTFLPKSKKVLPQQFGPFVILRSRKRGGAVRSFEQQLQGIERGLALIQRTRGRDDQRVMLGCVFKDLDALRDQVSTAPPYLGERYATLEAKALELRSRIGAPIAPDQEPGKAKKGGSS
jgi:hypothetical protein